MGLCVVRLQVRAAQESGLYSEECLMGLWCGALGRRVQLSAKGASGNLLPKEEGKLASRDIPRGRLRLLGLFRGLFGTVRHQISRVTLGTTEPKGNGKPWLAVRVLFA